MADPLGIVASILQLIIAAKASIGMVRDIANALKEQRGLFTEVRNLEPLLKGLEGRLRANPSVHGMLGLKDPLAQFKETMEPVMAKLRSANKPGSKIPKALSWTLWNKREAEEDLQKLERFKALLNTWLVLDIWCARQEGTGLWLLEEAKFKDWVSRPGAIFWCYGMPGAGKTVLSSAIVNTVALRAALGPPPVRAPAPEFEKLGSRLVSRSYIDQAALSQSVWDPGLSEVYGLGANLGKPTHTQFSEDKKAIN
ncbi:hypothetical protein C8J57DRAFT_1635445 [Mycena rebaudengoi]|nr:hypothetical protein C8J57DRAFT_1635445 [Mycena rebaudengoi]